ncbi:terminase [Thiomicrospira sp. XS5]|uniref:terminase large subunit domain-containing protein n=1 Tax=Thiomicrospira sp. XS5 TaxID=1775636 RepID=UPI0007469A2A|nr:terminase family protein [Thiomicrospira sp. XS5]KUJ73919.1 terminase [Thiomicrospira sp. XS5]
MTKPLLYPYQQAWLTNASRFKVGMFARQTGKTFTTTLEIVLDMLEAEANGKKTRWVILSRGERQAREAMEEGIKVHLNALQIAFEAYESDYFEGVQAKALEIKLPGGSRVTALPANPDTARGFSANVFLDEFAFHQDSKKIWKALFPVISAGWKLRVVSTPNGKGNKFYELMTGDDAEWYRQTVDIYQAVKDGLPRDVEQLKNALNDADAWSQEFELQWLDEASAWLDYELINAAEDPQSGQPERYQKSPVFVGVDIAARNDLFVIWVLEKVGDVLWTREIIERKRISFAEQDLLLAGVFMRYHVLRCAIDQTGMGEKPVEDAKRNHGQHRVEGVLFTNVAKQLLATQGKEVFEDKKIRIPQGNTALRDDLHSLQKIPTATGGVRFDADRTGNGHADRTWACFLAIHAATQPQWEADWTPTKEPEEVTDTGYREDGHFSKQGAW